MDSGELHYLTYDPEAIWADMMDAYQAEGGDALYPGDEKEMLLRSVLADITQVLAGVDNALRMQTLRYAAGEYLDVMGEGRSCPRIEASKAKTTVRIHTRTTGRAVTLGKGTAMTANGEMFYLLTDNLSLSGYEQTLTAEIEAERAGSAGNGLLAGTQMQLAVSQEAVDTIFASADAVGGNEREEDEVYRERIRNYWLTSVTTGPARQYEAAAMGVSSAIVDAKALRIGAGQVGVYLILSDDTGAAAILQAVTEALSDEELRPLTDQVTVSVAEEITYTLNVQYAADAGSTTSAAIAAAVAAYTEWQDNSVGRAFDPNRLNAYLYQAGCTRVIWGEGSKLGEDGAVEYTEIPASSRLKGSITLTALTS